MKKLVSFYTNMYLRRKYILVYRQRNCLKNIKKEKKSTNINIHGKY